MGHGWRIVVQVALDIDLPQPIVLPGPVYLGTPPQNVQLMHMGLLSLNSDTYCIWTKSQDVSINSDTYYWADSEKEDQDEALEEVMVRHDPIVRATLSLMARHVVNTKAICAFPVEGGPGQATSPVSSLMVFKRDQQINRERLLELYAKVGSCAKASVAANHVALAQRMHQSSATLSEVAIDAAILEYAKAVEYLANTCKVQSDSSIESARVSILRGLTRSLNGRKNDTKKIAKISEAADSLRRLEIRTVVEKVELFAEAYGLTETWKIDAAKLVRARNRHLAHPGGSLPSELRRELSQRAMVLALEAIANYACPQGVNMLEGSELSGGVEPPEGPTITWDPPQKKYYDSSGVPHWTKTPNSLGEHRGS